MRAVILAGGRGRRLRPVTDYVPKPLVPIRNVPIIQWQIRYLRRFGIREAIICAGYGEEMLRDYLESRDLGMRIRISAEKRPLGTGGAIKRAAGSITDGSFLVLNGDVITDIDLGRVIARQNSIASVRLRTGFGILRTSGDTVTGFDEKGEIGDVWINAGIYHLARSCVRDLPSTGDIERTLFVDYAKRGLLRAIRYEDAMWHSVDSFKDLKECESRIGDV